MYVKCMKKIEKQKKKPDTQINTYLTHRNINFDSIFDKNKCYYRI